MVTVEADGQPVKGSPFTCNVYNVQNIKVTGLGPAKVGKPVTFSVDATEAGEGTLELVISTDQSTVKAEVVACSRGLYDVTFVPHQLTPHFVSISFNDEDLPGSPLRCEVMELPGKKSTATARGEGLNQVVLGAVAYFEINPHTPEPGSIDAQVIGPDGSMVPVTIDKLETGLFRAKYRPACVGTHSITVLQRRQPITKQPFAVQVFDPLQVKITDLSEAFCHRAATFKVDTRGAGSGALSVNIRAAGSEVKHTLRELETPGLYQVVYHPQVAIPHRILIKTTT
ncbi:filamin-A [Nilaparvata lugens]|uniref:filamin-A n=1 Tax=Nilaparvata lugens TaxID=108931 RepID=UPI00193E60FD|nr:filamin-A [Nilaparvata lugens]